MAGPPLSLADFDEMPVGRLKGIGPKREAGFAQLGITTLYDVLTTYPRRYIDRTNEATIARNADTAVARLRRTHLVNSCQAPVR